MPFKALIVGGSGEMGQWCAGLLKKAGFEVSISSRRDASAVARSQGIGVATQADAGSFDLVILSVPIDKVEQVSSVVGPRMKPGSLLMDLSSLKKRPVESMLRHTPPSVEVIGSHPLFGPGTASLDGRTVVLVPSDRSERWLPIVRDVFEGAGSFVVVTGAEEHDRKMAVVQGLTHFMYIAWGRAVEKLDVNLTDLDSYQTPVYRITKEMAGRVLSQSPELYGLIQSGEDVSTVRRVFIESCTDLAGMTDSGDKGAFESAFREAAAHYGDTGEARRRSEAIIARDAEERASIIRSRGQERAFALAGGRHVYGTVREARREDFILDTPSETLVLRYDAVVPLGHEKLLLLKSSSPPVTRDLLVKLPIGADAKVLQWVLNRIGGVSDARFETSDALNSQYVVFRFSVDVSPEASEETLQSVLRTVWGLGYEVK